MEENRLFIKGEHDDFDIQNQPENTYRKAVNIVRDLDGSLRSEKGSVSIAVPNKTIIGSCTIGEVNVLFFYSEGNHEIGWFDESNNYSSVIISGELNFHLNQKISAVGELNYKGEKVVYFVDGINPDRVINLDNPPTSDIEDQLKLEVHSNRPEVKLASIGSNGSLPTGIYQFQIRLLTGSTNKTIPSLMTNPIPIVNESGNSQQVDGAPPQTSSFKSINLSISNLDLNFKTFEVIVTTYEGYSNVPRSYIVGRKAIVNSTSTFSLTSLDNVLEEITTDEVTVEPVVYSASKHITSKDGYLLRANLSGKKEGNDFQAVANAAKISYIIKEVPFSETVNIEHNKIARFERDSEEMTAVDKGTSTHLDGYHREEFSAFFKGYMRGEIYSHALVPEYTDGTTGSAYHIPAPISEFSNGAANKVTKALGTYVSTEVYPPGFGYPEGNVRLHRMPTLQLEPAYSNGMIRILGVKVEVDINLLPEDKRKSIAGWILVRQRRTMSNRSIQCQGIAQPMVMTGNAQEILMVSPFTGKNHYRYNTSERNEAKNRYMEDHVAFYSPDIILGGELPVADRIERVGVAEGTAYLAGMKVDSGVSLNSTV